MSGKRVAIIGAGVAGLVSIKSCLEEGLQPVCFERHDDIGGLWYYTEQLRKGQGAATYDSVVTNHSKEMSCFSDFPFPKAWPPFLSRLRVHEYLHSYADHFALKKYITFNANVIRIETAIDGGWTVIISNGIGGKTEEIFDYVMVCTGVFSETHFPSYPGFENFDGIKIHSNEYRDSGKFKDKRVVVVGAANTAGEVACELARNGSIQVFLSMRNGTLVFPRIGVQCIPWDLLSSRSVVDRGRILDKISKWRIQDHTKIGLQCSEPATASIMANDDIQDRIVQGKLEPVVGIEKLGKNSVTLVDGRILDDIGAVVFATGYKIAFPFLKDTWVFGKCLYFYVMIIDYSYTSAIVTRYSVSD
uniref:Flavin-containing monooxygenase n=1 Tax=Saccoglossus kowalevskii TaxID=10224 RepID=A0ABM0MTS1_SACKO|nr:PREDICTED: dimethylaniline monooxygenase [N-oxide-forming] 5-like [Saccoglossus kowalevskii]